MSRERQRKRRTKQGQRRQCNQENEKIKDPFGIPVGWVDLYPKDFSTRAKTRAQDK